jgi:acetyl esterase/lipase
MTRLALPVLALALAAVANAQTPSATDSTAPAAVTASNVAPATATTSNTPPPVYPDPPAWFTQRGQIVPLWPEGKMPGVGADAPENYNHSPPNGLIRVSDVSNPTLEIFKAPNATGPVPAVIICPGGGYGILAYNAEGTEAAAWLNKIGITGIVLKYRVPKNRDGAFMDIQRAMRLVRQNAAQWGVRPDKLGVLGFSAGGHLAARLSTNFSTPAYPAIDAADTQSCQPNFALLVYAAYLSEQNKLVPEIAVTSAVPPTFICVAADDARHAVDCLLYDSALAAANVPQELHVYPRGGHGFALRSNLEAKVWPTQAAAWLHTIGVL